MASAAEETGTEACGHRENRCRRAHARRPSRREEKAEKEARKACKIEICDVLATKDPAGSDISCDIVKTWREAAIAKMLGGKFDWPWGKAVCQSKLVVKREVLAKAMSEASYEVVMPSAEALLHASTRRRTGKPYVVDVSIAPKVAFENGKAVTSEPELGRGQRTDACLRLDLCRHRRSTMPPTFSGRRWCAW